MIEKNNFGLEYQLNKAEEVRVKEVKENKHKMKEVRNNRKGNFPTEQAAVTQMPAILQY